MSHSCQRQIAEQKFDSVEISPVTFADRLGLDYTALVTGEHKKNLGQFFTSIEIANFLAGFAQFDGKKIRILDPGSGTGILSCAVAEYLVNNSPNIQEIEITAFESDPHLIPFAEKSYSYLREWLQKRNVNFNHFLCANDFILHNSSLLTNVGDIHEKFNVIISNPPYFKIPKLDPRAIAAKSVIYGQTNIYSIFLIVSAKLLEKNGQLIFIAPRSFASGNYFKLFREIFFSLIDLQIIHLFNSRREAFLRDNVLQENIIVCAKRKQPESLKGKTKSFSNEVTISTSAGVSDIDSRTKKVFKFTNLVNLKSPQKILHLPLSTVDENAIKIFKSWTSNLDTHGIDISTGPVVDFRSLQFISHKKDNETFVPLIWLNNVKPMDFEWPLRQKSKGKNKGQYIAKNDQSTSRLVKNKNYVLLRRFSSKDDASRLTACHYFSKWLPQFSHIGIENHLNYIYKKDDNLSRLQVLGIAALLNSKLFDVYFRTFNGNINVSATELREMPFPSLEHIEKIGNLVDKAAINRNVINAIIESIFKINLSKYEQ